MVAISQKANTMKKTKKSSAAKKKAARASTRSTARAKYTAQLKELRDARKTISQVLAQLTRNYGRLERKYKSIKLREIGLMHKLDALKRAKS